MKDVSGIYEALAANLACATQLADTDIPYVSAQCGDVEEVAIQSALSGEITSQQAIDQMAQGLEADHRGRQGRHVRFFPAKARLSTGGSVRAPFLLMPGA